jgi:hypothetical protein
VALLRVDAGARRDGAEARRVHLLDVRNKSSLLLRDVNLELTEGVTVMHPLKAEARGYCSASRQ